MLFFSIWCLKGHFPLVDNVVTIRFLTIIPRYFARVRGNGIKRLGIFINILVKSLFKVTRTFPKFNEIFVIFFKEMMQFAKNGHGVRLEWMQFAVEYFLRSMDGIGDDDDFRYVFFDACLIDAVSKWFALMLYVINCWFKKKD